MVTLQLQLILEINLYNAVRPDFLPPDVRIHLPTVLLLKECSVNVAARKPFEAKLPVLDRTNLLTRSDEASLNPLLVTISALGTYLNQGMVPQEQIR
jgi:hypothetical protein